MSKKKILIFHPALAPYRIDYFNFLSNLYDIEIVFIFDNVWNHKFDQEKLLSQLNCKYSFLLKGLEYKGRVFRLGMLKVIKQSKPDIIISYEYSFTTQYLIALKTLGFINQKLGSTIDDNIHICNEVQSKSRFLARNYAIKKLDFIVVLSREVAEYYRQKFRLFESRIVVFPIVQSPERLRSNSNRLERQAEKYVHQYDLRGRKVLLFVGRFIPEKSLPLFINNLSSILNANENVKLILVGDGEEKSVILAAIKNNHLEGKVLLPGRFEGEELLAWYLCASGFVMPSTYEPFGAVVNEALIFGLPVFCSQYAGSASLLNDDLSLVFNPTDATHVVQGGQIFLNRINNLESVALSDKPSIAFFDREVIENELHKIKINFDNKIAIICKYIPSYRHSVFNELCKLPNTDYAIIADINAREGIEPISLKYLTLNPINGGIKWLPSISYYYTKSLQFWQTNVISKIFSKDYSLYILDGAVSHLSTWIFAICCIISGKKVIFWSHGFKGTDKGIIKVIRTFFFKHLPHALILYSDYSKNLMVKEGFDASKIFVIGNSLDYDLQKKVRTNLIQNSSKSNELKKSIFNNNDKTLIFIGRLIANKKVDKIISSIYTLKKKGIDLNCIIIGDGEFKKELINLVAKSELQNQFHFANSIYDETEIGSLFVIADLMVSPGNVGLNCIHSLAYGVPVLTHDNFSHQNPEVEAIIDHENGLFYKHNDYDDMTNKIKLWFELYDNETVFVKCIDQIENKFNPVVHSNKIHNAVLTVLKND